MYIIDFLCNFSQTILPLQTTYYYLISACIFSLLRGSQSGSTQRVFSLVYNLILRNTRILTIFGLHILCDKILRIWNFSSLITTPNGFIVTFIHVGKVHYIMTRFWHFLWMHGKEFIEFLPTPLYIVWNCCCFGLYSVTVAIWYIPEGY